MAKTKLYVGGTGCGKTYRAINEATSFVIAVPCRQLAYEIFWDYPEKVSRLDTGEVHMGPVAGNQVCVYENISEYLISQDTLIIDEAHYINDPERGGALLEKILANKGAGKEVILLTATDTLSDEVKQLLEVEEINLQPFCKTPKKIKVFIDEFSEKVKAGMSAIIFTKYTPNSFEVAYYANAFGISVEDIGVLSASTPSYERVKTQLDFKSGKLQVVISTNVLAQGLNFPAQGVFVEYNEYDDWEIVTQKIGRIARPHFGLREGFYCLDEAIPEKYRSRGVPENAEKKAEVYWRPSSGTEVDISEWGFKYHEIPEFYGYKGFKYSFRFLREVEERLGSLEPEEHDALDFLKQQSEMVRELLEQRPTVREAA